jgi:hypothetical protein
MKQVSVRWGELGSPIQPGMYRCGPHMIEVTPGDIKKERGPNYPTGRCGRNAAKSVIVSGATPASVSAVSCCCTGGEARRAENGLDTHSLRKLNALRSAGDTPGPQDREILSYDGRVMLLKYVDPEIDSRYGTGIFVRCARRA